MTVDDVISCMNVVKYYNPNMRTLYDTFVEQAPNIVLHSAAIDAADASGQPIYETIISLEIELANAIHDYIYNVIHPLDSVNVKNTIREQMSRDLFGLEANF